MKDQQTIEQRVKQVIAEQLGVNLEQVTDEATFEQLGADSLDAVELMLAVEEEFEGVSISDEMAEQIETVSQAVELVERLAKEVR